MNILKMLDGGTGYYPELGYAVFQNEDGTTTKLSWRELKLAENGDKYKYKNITRKQHFFSFFNFALILHKYIVIFLS